MPNGFGVTEKDWEGMTSLQQSWMTFNAVQSLDTRVSKLEKRPLVDKCFSFVGGVIGGALAAVGIKWGN